MLFWFGKFPEKKSRPAERSTIAGWKAERAMLDQHRSIASQVFGAGQKPDRPFSDICCGQGRFAV
jgi:hypothetical protein